MQDRSQRTDTHMLEWQQEDLGNRRAMSMRDIDGDEYGDEEERSFSTSRDTTWHNDIQEDDSGEVAMPDSHRRANGANTQRILRYFMDRERSGLSEEEERARGTGWYRPHALRARPDDTPRRAWYPSAWSSSRRHHDDADRTNRMPPPWTHAERFNSNTPATNCTSFYLENALKYLDCLRECDSFDQAYEAAVDCSLVERGEDELQPNMIMKVSDIKALQSSSWLQAGTIFDGHQYASTAVVPSSHTSTRDASRRYMNSTSPIDHPPGSTSFISYGDVRTAESPQPQRHRSGISTGRDLSNDHWPVRVILHTVCAEQMLIQGTMEAYDVPQHSPHLPLPETSSRKAGRKNAPIVTFVEGHIIDFAKHSLLTPMTQSTAESRIKYGRDDYTNTTLLTEQECGITFPYATPTIDAANWRKLPPFNQLKSDHAMAQMLLSKDAMEKLNDEWIFMRWKERCFVHGKDDPCTEQDRRSDHDRGHGLTISGFYYVSMSRLNGTIEGLYFDPNSTPYQHLRLKGGKCMWPALEMR
ncbi:hypothetical protein MRB53_042250 [Persea americana]|nr:hypothetical protein MRB53_042250 [Persea americana]